MPELAVLNARRVVKCVLPENGGGLNVTGWSVCVVSHGDDDVDEASRVLQ